MLSYCQIYIRISFVIKLPNKNTNEMYTIDDDLAMKRLNLSNQYLNEATADVIFICGQGDNKGRVPAHKFVLFTHSDVFDRMFHGSLPEKKEIEIVDASPNGFRTFLRYFYFDKYMLNIDVVGEAMYLAKKYNIDKYFNACCEFLKMKPQLNVAKHILIGYDLAIAYELMDIKDFFEENIYRHAHEVFASEYMRSISYNLLKCILQMRHIHRCTELVFDACMAWAEEACINANIDPNMQNCRKQLGECFGKIEFGVMSHADLVRCVIKYGDLFTSQELKRFIIMIAAKCPTPFNEDTSIRYHIGKKTLVNTVLQADSIGELHFNSRVRILLGGVAIVPLLDADMRKTSFFGIISIVKVSTNKQKADDIVLLRDVFEIEAINPSNYDLKSSKKLMLTEALIVEPHSKYCVELSFHSTSTESSGDSMGSPYHKHNITPSEDFPFRILPETNCKVVSELIYSRID